jgi:hypothetical protein
MRLVKKLFGHLSYLHDPSHTINHFYVERSCCGETMFCFHWNFHQIPSLLKAVQNPEYRKVTASKNPSSINNLVAEVERLGCIQFKKGLCRRQEN